CVALFSHLRRASHVKQVLEDSEWHRELKGLGIRNHILQAFVSGLITHACLLMPAVIFWRLTGPTYVREAALLVGSLLTAPWRASLQRMRRTGVAVSVPTLLLNTFL